MITNLAQVHRKHAALLTRIDRSILETAEEAARFAENYTATTKLGFTPRSGEKGLSHATRARVIRTNGGRIVKVTNLKKYAAAIDKGSKPHVIKPRKSKVLKFRLGNRWVSAKQVRHPGTRPTRFLWRTTFAAYRVSGPNLQERLEKDARFL